MAHINFFALLCFFFSVLVSADHQNYCKDLALVPSSKSSDRIFLTAQCLGMFGNTTTLQCSYLDLNACYALSATDKKYHPQRRGNGMDYDHVWACRLTYSSNDHKKRLKASGMECTKPGELGGTYTADFSNVIGADIGFLTCFGRAGFLCPEPGEHSPY
ncbi:uncharacterized protein PG998_010031 [Apiospora kogelbergensis]|uniref:uncharacterized protein n=1 Tax=Apiospora kogelbergensis TaxID=1337665 RepID=UPI0031314848